MAHELVEKAKAFAHKVHGSINHQRKYTGEPYTNHLESVATLVAEVTSDQEMIAAAWLHDTIEDTPTTFEDIEQEFGNRVATLVSELTDVSVPEDGTREVRKSKDRAHTAAASPAAKTVKLADLIDNSKSIRKYDPRFAKVYMYEKKLLLSVLKEGDSKLYAMATEIVESYYSS